MQCSALQEAVDQQVTPDRSRSTSLALHPMLAHQVLELPSLLVTSVLELRQSLLSLVPTLCLNLPFAQLAIVVGLLRHDTTGRATSAPPRHCEASRSVPLVLDGRVDDVRASLT